MLCESGRSRRTERNPRQRMRFCKRGCGQRRLRAATEESREIDKLKKVSTQIFSSIVKMLVSTRGLIDAPAINKSVHTRITMAC